MITIDLIDEHFDQPEKPARVKVPSARSGRGREQTFQEGVSVQQDQPRPGLFAGIWLMIKRLLSL